MLTVAQIRNYPLFEGLSETELNALAPCMVRRSFVKNAYLFQPGIPAMNLYLVESGIVRIFSCNNRGEEFILNLMGPRSVIGPPLMNDNQMRIIGAAAQMPAVVLSLSYEDLFRVMGFSRQLNFNLYREMAAQMRKLLLHYQSFITLGLESRTASLLLHLGEGKMNELLLPISQAELAGWLGVSRGRLNRTLIKFQKQGLIRLEDGKLFNLDRAKLEQLIEKAGFKDL